MNNIGYKIRKARELKGFSQDYVAQKLNISQRAYSKIELGEIKIDNEKIKDISSILEVNPEDLQKFDESFIFNNCTQSGKFDNFINQLPERLIQQYEARTEFTSSAKLIKQLEKENEFLRGLHNDKQ